MYKLRKIILAVFLVALLALPAFAVTVATMGAPDSSGNYPVVVDDSHYVTFNGGVYAKYELATTNDTITAAEAGTTFVIKSTNPTTTDTVSFVLPTAVAGMEFEFILADDLMVSIDSVATDTFIYGTTGFEAGDILCNSTSATGDAIKVFSPVANWWAVESIAGTWAECY